MKKFLLVLVLVALPTHAFAAGVPERFYVSGSGFGHGVGLSQIGAKGLALEGKSASDILSYYFPGTTLTTNPDLGNIRVNIAHAATYITLTNTTSTLSLNKSDGTPVASVPIGSSLKFAVVTKVISPTIQLRSRSR